MVFSHYFVNQVSRLSMKSAPFARKSHCLHSCLHNEVRVLPNNLFTILSISIIRNLFILIHVISGVHKELWSIRIET